MQTLHFSIFINAPKEKVWDTMLDKTTYSKWTVVFSPEPNTESTFEGSWDEGADIKFVAPNKEGKLEGMVSRIKENRKYEFISIEHRGVMKDGKEDFAGPESEGWAGAHENYTFVEKDGGTEVQVDTDAVDDFAEFFSDTWPKALEKLKELAEK